MTVKQRSQGSNMIGTQRLILVPVTLVCLLGLGLDACFLPSRDQARNTLSQLLAQYPDLLSTNTNGQLGNQNQLYPNNQRFPNNQNGQPLGLGGQMQQQPNGQGFYGQNGQMQPNGYNQNGQMQPGGLPNQGGQFGPGGLNPFG